MNAPRAVAVLLAVAALGPLAASLTGARAAQDPVPAPKPGDPAPAPAAGPAAAPAAAPVDEAKARKDAKVRRFLKAARWRESVMKGLDASFDAQVAAGRIPKEFPKKFKETADFEALEKIAADSWGSLLDEATLDAAIAFHESEEGKKYTEASLGILASMNEKLMPWAMEQGSKVMTALMEESPPGEAGADKPAAEKGGIIDRLRGQKRSANETAAIATLRNLASCQAQIQTSGKIDADKDGIGEYGTFLEMTGSVSVRKHLTEGPIPASDFSEKGTPVNPPIVSAKMSTVGPDGVVKKSGYCYRIYLPDSASPSLFIHETGPAATVGLAGGSGMVGVDMAETTWCAYAWPEKYGDSGRRAFFVNQSGDVMQSSNEVSKWSGDKGPAGNAAFRGAGITSEIAVGTAGHDGDVWKVTN